MHQNNGLAKVKTLDSCSLIDVAIFSAFVTFRGLGLYREKIVLNTRAKMTNLIYSSSIVK